MLKVLRTLVMCAGPSKAEWCVLPRIFLPSIQSWINVKHRLSGRVMLLATVGSQSLLHHTSFVKPQPTAVSKQAMKMIGFFRRSKAATYFSRRTRSLVSRDRMRTPALSLDLAGNAVTHVGYRGTLQLGACIAC
jgi:hypothetical protein